MVKTFDTRTDVVSNTSLKCIFFVSAVPTVTMNSNIRFYIKYRHHQPILIETYYDCDTERRRPLLVISHLISACASGVTRKLLGLPDDFNSLSVHSVVNGIESTALRTDLLLSELAGSSNYDNPLIIRSLNDSLTIDDYMLLNLPSPVYSPNIPLSNSSRYHWKKPAHVFLWSDFPQKASNWIDANHLQHSQFRRSSPESSQRKCKHYSLIFLIIYLILLPNALLSHLSSKLGGKFAAALVSLIT